MKLVRPGIVLASIALAVAVPLSTTAAASSSNIQPTTGTISGTVTGAGSAPIVGACISLESSGSPFSPNVAVTNAQGVYTITGVTPNQSDPYEVAVDPSCSGGPNANYMPYTSPDFNVVAGQTSIVNAALTLGASITGRVLLGGTPTGGVCVAALGQGAQGYQVTSAANGTYALGGMTPGTFTVQFQACSGTSQPNIQPVYYGAHADGSPSNVTVVLGQQLALGDQVVQAGGEVDLKLTDGQGHPLTTDVFPILFVTDTSWAGISAGRVSAAPDANGYWHTEGLLPKSYEIEYWYCPSACRAGPIGYYAGHGVGGTPTPVTPVAGGATLSLTDVVAIPADSTTSSVVTFSPSAPSAGQTVTFKATITDPQTGTVPTGDVDFLSDAGPLGSATLNGQGVATLALNTLTAGVYHVYSSYAGDGDSESSSSSSVTVTVGAAVAGGGGGGGGSTAPVSAIVPAGGSASSDPAGTVPDASNPLVVGVTSPTGGTVTIDKTPPDTSVAHYTVLGVGATITAPPATTSNPLTLTFQIFDKLLPAGSGRRTSRCFVMVSRLRRALVQVPRRIRVSRPRVRLAASRPS